MCALRDILNIHVHVVHLNISSLSVSLLKTHFVALLLKKINKQDVQGQLKNKIFEMQILKKWNQKKKRDSHGISAILATFM